MSCGRREGFAQAIMQTMSITIKEATYPSLQGRVVLVTGGASGIGEAIVEAFARQRSQVVFLDIQDDAANRLVERLVSVGLNAPGFLLCDVTDCDAIQRVVGEVVQRYGRVDVLVNNAGNDTRHSVESVTSASWDAGMAANLKHQFFMAQAVAPSMRAVRRGTIINMGSISWVIPSTNVPVYVTAKSAIVGMT